MKKTLIALAALAVSGVSFAEVTISGSLIMGYKATKSTGTNAISIPGLGLNAAAVAGGEASGFGVDTSEIDITATENLGGGQSIEAKLALAGADRSGESGGVTTGNGAVTGRDATLSYTNNAFGRIQMGTTMESAIHSDIPSAGAPVIDMDGKLFEIRTSSDFISYAAPIGPVIFQYKLSESSKGLGLGAGSSGTSGVTVGQRTSDFAVVYGKGPLQLVGVYRSYDNRNAVSVATAEGLTKNEAIAIQAGYDFGVAKLGFGIVNTTATVGPKVSDMMLGVSIPVSAWTFGMTFGRSTVSGVADAAVSVFPGGAGADALFKSAMQRADGTADSVSVGVKYDLSKRTSLSLKHATWTRSGYEQFEAWGARAKAGASVAGLNEFGYSDRASETSLLLAHTF
jgi:predicted porin